jgi:hypothetical protein
MTQRPLPRRNRALAALAALSAVALSALLALPALAAPGAHGPGGEHLDQPNSVAVGAALPRFEARSELFEMVGTLHGGELSVLIDRYQSNEPVLGASLEVEMAGIKAKATFDADQGDYAIDDPALLKALSAPGEHALVFTLVAGQDADLLDGQLVVGAHGAASGHGHGHDHAFERALWIGAGVAGLALLTGLAWWRQRRRASGYLTQGGKA